MKILIVDDNRENVYLLEVLLKGSGYDVVSATNGEEALEELRAEGFDMIVSDILMPVMDGFQLCKECKEDEKLKDIPFVFHTAEYAEEEDEKLALKLGADKFIRKPIEADEFIKVIQGVFRDLEEAKKKPVVAGMRILVVEDKEDSRNLLVKVLRAYGHETAAAADGAEALEQALAQPPDMIVSDILMPKMDGYQLCQECKQNEQLKNIPFVFYTATYTLDEDRKFALSLGADAFIVKPAEPDVFVQTLCEVFEKTKSGALAPPEAAPPEPSLFLTEYTKRIFAKLEDKVAQLETEITQRKRAEEALKDLVKKIERAKQEWESTADSLPELVCLVDDRGRIIRANRTVETWELGRVVDVKGQGVHELLHPGCADSSCYLNSFWKQAWGEALRGQPAQCEAYDEILQRHVLVRLRPWKDWGKGTAIGFTVVIVRDITERKRAEEALQEYSERLEEMVNQLQEAQEELIRKDRLAILGQLAGGVGHELRNPLGVVNNSVYYLNMKLRDADEKVKKHLKIMEREITRCNKIINDLLSFARVMAPDLTEVHINALVAGALSRTPVPENVAVVTELGEGLPLLMADVNQIEQVFINMISNAVQAMTSSSLRAEGSVETSDGGRLEIATKEEDGFIVTEFKDNGCGIPVENLEKIFEPLFTTKAKGMGLGLAVSKTMVEGHGGSIEVESPSAEFIPSEAEGLGPRTEPVEVTGEVGKGTTFRVKLPALIRQSPDLNEENHGRQK